MAIVLMVFCKLFGNHLSNIHKYDESYLKNLLISDVSRNPILIATCRRLIAEQKFYDSHSHEKIFQTFVKLDDKYSSEEKVIRKMLKNS